MISLHFMKRTLKTQDKEVNSRCVERTSAGSHMRGSAVMGVAAVVVGTIIITTGIIRQE